MTDNHKRNDHDRTSDGIALVAQQIPALLVDARGRVLVVSPQAVAEFGIRPEAWIGQFVDEILPPLSAAGAGPDSRTSRGEPRTERRFGPEGDPSARRLESIEVQQRRGDRWLFLVDRTELFRARSECMHLGQLASAGRLISSIVHEINNPLSGIIGYVQLLLLQDHDRETRAALEKIQSEAMRSSRIVRNLLDFSRRRPLTEIAVDLGGIVRKALELKAHDLRVHNVTVQLDLPRTLPPVAADPYQLLQVFVNLVANAEQAMYETDRGGRIVCQATPGKHHVVVIRDTGPGVTPENRERIFDPFFTTKAEGKGTGLGLGLCREILHRLGGTIHLWESTETGAAFEIALPIASATATVETPKRRAKREIVRGRRILIVEDDPVCRSWVSEVFESTENEVHAFDRSEAALKFLRSRWVDVIISDLHRPGSNGLEFHAEVKKIDEQLAKRILFLTGDTMNQEFARFLSKSGNPVLPKPAQLDDLHRAVQKLLARPSRRQKTLFTGDD